MPGENNVQPQPDSAAASATAAPLPQVTPRPLDINDQLAAQIVLLGMQQVADNARLAQNTLLAYQKDLFQGGQAEVTSAIAAMRSATRVTTGG